MLKLLKSTDADEMFSELDKLITCQGEPFGSSGIYAV